MTQILTLTTDFGQNDYYVGVVKGVILSINPDLKLVDINHNIEPQNIVGAAINLRNSYNYFPEGTIHLVVVDPGVGNKRLPIIVKTDKYFFVGPDNGLFTYIYEENSFEVFHITNTKYFLRDISDSFHGRDIFGPVSAHLSLLNNPHDFGNRINEPVRISLRSPKQTGKKISGEVIYIDHFGNLITNISNDSVDRKCEVVVGGINIGSVSKSYSSVEIKSPVAIYGSSGFLEVAVNQGNAAENFSGKPGIEIIFK